MSLKQHFTQLLCNQKFSFLTLDLGNDQGSLGALEEVAAILSAES